LGPFRRHGGVGTHADQHVAAVIDTNGGVLGIESFPADHAGCETLLGWFTSYGEIDRVGVEGTGSWGVGLARFLHDHEILVVEVDRPNRQNRRRVGKSDPTDAVRAALSGSASVIPKTRNGPVEQMRILMVARCSARSQRIETLNQLRHLVFTGPEEVRTRFKDRYKTGLVTEVAKLRPRKGSDPVLHHHGDDAWPGQTYRVAQYGDQSSRRDAHGTGQGHGTDVGWSLRGRDRYCCDIAGGCRRQPRPVAF
jgi:transposase